MRAVRGATAIHGSGAGGSAGGRPRGARPVALLLHALPALLPVALGGQVPVHLEPHHRNVLENGAVRVLDVLIPPGDTTLFHEHSHNSVTVLVSGARTWNQREDGTSTEGERGKVGAVGANLSYAEMPATHRVANRDSVPFRILVIELMASPGVVSAPDADPLPGMEVVLANRVARAWRVVLEPGEASAARAFARAGLLVHLSGGRVAVPDGRVEEEPAGRVVWREAGARPPLRNSGEGRIELIEIELR